MAAGRLDRAAPPAAAEIAAAPMQVPGDIDHARARADAAVTLASIDFSKSDIAIWVPATRKRGLPAEWSAAVGMAFGDRASSVTMDYPASFDFNDSVSTGMETLRLVLHGIAAQGGGHRVMLGGHSQGAWVIGDAIDVPELGRMVDKAVLFGHPSTARVSWSSGSDPRVREIDDPADPITHDLVGAQDALDALDDIVDEVQSRGGDLDMTGIWHRLRILGDAVLHNPAMATYVIGRPVAYIRGGDPHKYEHRYAEGAEFLAAL